MINTNFTQFWEQLGARKKHSEFSIDYGQKH